MFPVGHRSKLTSDLWEAATDWLLYPHRGAAVRFGALTSTPGTGLIGLEVIPVVWSVISLGPLGNPFGTKKKVAGGSVKVHRGSN